MIQNLTLTTPDDETKIINLYHLDLFKSVGYLKKEFSDVKVVCMGGKASRMRSLAEELRSRHGGLFHNPLEDFSVAGGRFSMFKTNKVVFLSHGMGNPSISIALDEVTKMLFFAGAKDVIYIRIGTCGGLGLEPGTIVLTEKCYSSSLEQYLELFVCGNSIKKPAIIDRGIVSQFRMFSETHANEIKDSKVIEASTLCCNTFYEEQARMDGCVCSNSEEEKRSFFERLIKKFNIRNIEMESLGFAAFCHSLKIRGFVVSFVIVDRMVSDEILLTHEYIERFEHNLNDLVLDFVMDVTR